MTPPRPTTTPSGTPQRAGVSAGNGWLTMLDAGLSSGSNFVVAAAVASRLDATALGQYALAFTAYALGYGMWRAWACEPALAVGATTVDVGAVLSGSALVGLGLGVVGAGASAIIAQPGVADPLLWLSLGLPIHAAHDGLRFAAIGRGRAKLALVLDGAWLAAMAPLVLLAPDVRTLLIGWAALGAASLVIGMIAMGAPFAVHAGWAWLGRAAPLGRTYAAEFVVAAVGLQAVLIGVGAVAGFAEMGRYRVATIVASPVMVVVAGLATIAVVSGRRRADDEPETLLRFVAALAALGAAAGLAVAAVAAVVPDAVASAVLGPTWAGARAESVWLSIAVGGIAVITIAANAFRVLDASAVGGRWRIVAMLAVAGSGVAGATVAGSLGTTVAMAATAFLFGLMIMAAFARRAEGPDAHPDLAGRAAPQDVAA